MKKLYFINLILITGLLALNFNSFAQGYNVTLPTQYNTTNAGGTEVLSFPGATANANGDGTLTIYYGQGDFSASSEFLTMTGETGSSIGITTAHRGDCNATYDSNVFTIPMATINSWAATGGKIDISCLSTSAVNNFCSGGGSSTVSFGVYGKLTYPFSTGPNDAGTSSISPTLVCSGINPVDVTIDNFGTNQITSVIVNWMKNGVLQTPINYTSTLDTTGGTGSTSAIISLGSHSFASANTFTVWTSMPNSVTDTSTANDTVSVTLTPSLSGTFTINRFAPPTGNNYQTWATALADLRSIGICGPTVFNVSPGTYTGQIDIGNITGSSSVNTITFNGTGATSILEHNATGSSDADNCVVKFNKASYITFNNFTINTTNTSGLNRVITLLGNNDHIIIKNNTLNGFKGITTSNWAAIIYNPSGVGSEFITIDSNIMNDGAYGLYWYGGNTTTFEEGNIIINNTINNFFYSGVFFYYQENGNVSNNVMTGDPASNTSPFGIYSYYGDGNTLNSNDITLYGTSTTYGIYPRNVKSVKIKNNKIILNSPSTNYGIYPYRCIGTATNKVEIMNNMVRTSTTASTSSHYGIYLREGKFQDLLHNSVSVPGGGSNSAALYIYGSTSSTYGDNNIQNNIFATSGLGYALYTNGTSVTGGTFLTSLDYNAYEATTGNFFRYPTTNYTTFVAYQTATAANGHEVNSLFGIPGFLSSTDLHVQGPTGSNAGNNALSTAMDIDGDVRPLSPDVTVDMGADEFNVPPCPAPSALSFISATSIL
jgi:hypothetical protein